MKRKVAHVLRRTARVLIRKSNKLDPPATLNYNVINVNGAISAAIDIARQQLGQDARYL